MAKGAKVTENKFKAIKILLQSGAKYQEISETMEVSKVVIGIVKNAETYEEYKHKMYLTSGAYRKKMAAEAKAKEEEKIRAEKEAEQKTAEKEKAKGEGVSVVEHRQTVTIQATHYMMEEMKKTNELLTAISSKLAFIVESLS